MPSALKQAEDYGSHLIEIARYIRIGRERDGDAALPIGDTLSELSKSALYAAKKPNRVAGYAECLLFLMDAIQCSGVGLEKVLSSTHKSLAKLHARDSAAQP